MRVVSSYLNLGMVSLMFLFFATTEAISPMKILNAKDLGEVTEAISPMKVFNVKDFGAIKDDIMKSTEALLSAWKEACAWNGEGRILIPKGIFLLGPIVVNGPCKGNMIFEVKGVVKAAANLNIFNSGVWIDFQNINGLVITGGGSFDGQGALAWSYVEKCSKHSNCKVPPHSIRLYNTTNAIVNEISFVDSKHFHINIIKSNNIQILSVKISAPDKSPNTNGIHIGDSSGVTIANSVIGTGGDCVSLAPGSCNVSISNVFCGPGHGISVGSLGKNPNEAEVANFIVRNCTFVGTMNGIRIKTWEGSPVSYASNFTFEGIVMKNVYNPIIIDQEYCPDTSCNKKGPSRVKISNVKFNSISGTSASQVAVNIICSEGMPCQKVEFKDMHLVFKGQGSATAACTNVYSGSSNGSSDLLPPFCF